MKQPQQPLVHLPPNLFVSLLPQIPIDAVVVAEVGGLPSSDLGIGAGAELQLGAHLGVGCMRQRGEVAEQRTHFCKEFVGYRSMFEGVIYPPHFGAASNERLPAAVFPSKWRESILSESLLRVIVKLIVCSSVCKVTTFFCIIYTISQNFSQMS